MSKDTKKNKGLFSTLSRWFKRGFFGHGKEMDNMAVEEIVSPSKMIFREFLSRPVPVICCILMICMFLLVFVGPQFVPLDLNYTELLQSSVSPGYNMMSVPSELAKDVKSISSYASFSIGLDNSGNVYTWGDTSTGAAGIDLSDIPEEVQNANILFAAAGFDHCIAIDDQGNVYGWGNNKLGQYPGTEYEDPNASVAKALPDAKVDIDNVKDLKCGYQSTAIIMKDGSLITFGNSNTCMNMKNVAAIKDGIVDVTYTGAYMVALLDNGRIGVGNMKGIYDTVNGDPNLKLASYMAGRRCESIASTYGTVCLMLIDDELDAAATTEEEKAAAREVIFTGSFSYGENKLPTLAKDEYFVQIEGGTNHYSGLTNKGNVYSWGSNHLRQLNVDKDAEGCDKIIVTSFQNYALDENGALQAKWGLKGYIFGTDTKGADVFARCIHGGKMTMTVGAIAVIVSTIIAIIIGCISGYAGGLVDLLLMRLAEIFNAIPFLPFALILSSALLRSSLTENQKIFIIMIILGVLTWPSLAKLIRAQILAEREKEFVTAAKSLGVTENRIAFKHILPNVMSVILVNISLSFASCMLTESSLSYLGFGVQYPRPTWGNMLNGANNSVIIKNYWWQWFFPSLLLAICTICINIIGDNIRDVMDPKSNRDK